MHRRYEMHPAARGQVMREVVNTETLITEILLALLLNSL